MGNDGGSIPTRRELVKASARAPTASELKATTLESLGHAWSHCALSGTPIDPAADTPVAADASGRLYSYEAVLAALAALAAPIPTDGPDDAAPAGEDLAVLGIRTIRDLVLLHPAPPPPTAAATACWLCPLSRKPLAAGTRAVYLVPCGHVFAEAALREAGGDSCPECGAVLEPAAAGEEAGGGEVGGQLDGDSVVVLLPTTKKDVERSRRRVERLRSRGLTHSLKKERTAGEGNKDKKKKRKRKEGNGEEETEGRKREGGGGDGKEMKKPKKK